MLIGARDEDGTAVMLGTLLDKDDTRLAGESGNRWWETDGDRLLCDSDAEPFCQNIPPGERRVIDLEKSVIVHVAPKKTAVEELVEACDRLLAGVGLMEHAAESCAFRTVGTKSVSDLHFALARVRQEMKA